jgi:hypothetical protein
MHSFLRRAAGGDAIKADLLERRRSAPLRERGGEGGAPGVGYLGVASYILLLLTPAHMVNIYTHLIRIGERR